MRKIFLKLIIFSVLELVILLSPPRIFAQESPFDCGFRIECKDPAEPNCKVGKNSNSTTLTENTKSVKFIFELSKVSSDLWNQFQDENSDGKADIFDREYDTHPDSSTWCDNKYVRTGFNQNTVITDTRSYTDFDPSCDPFSTIGHTFSLKARDNNNTSFELCRGTYNVEEEHNAYIKVTSTTGLQDVNSQWNVEITNVSISGGVSGFSTNLDGQWLNDNYTGNYLADRGNLGNITNDKSETIGGNRVYFRLKALSVGIHSISINTGTTSQVIKAVTFTVLPKGAPTPTLTPVNTPTPTLPFGAPTYTPPPPIPSLAPICDQIDSKYQGTCWNCINQGKLWTAIGCIPTDMETILKEYVFIYGVGIAGGIAFLYFIYGVFLILTSAGNAEKIAEAKEIIISALSGLFLIIFSVFLLRVIGVDVLRLPGFV